MKYLSEQFTSYDRYLELEAFSEGRSFDAWKLLGSHPDTKDGEVGYRFLVWAPRAKTVHLVGNFNQWNENTHPMDSLEGGLWELFVPRLSRYDSYKYAITSQTGKVVLKADPYGFHAETRPATATKLYPLDEYQWNDSGWQSYKETHNPYNSAMNVYELHLGSWRRGGNGEFLDYRTMASMLVPYVKEMGYTHVELMPVMEHPLDDSWGYQVTGYFATTSRFGTPDDLKYLIDQLHQGGIAVILDWVPAHFPRDEFGLFEFDGSPTYEYEDAARGQHPQWGTNCFDLGRKEVKSFLFSSAMFWIEEFHADGLRVDAVSSMLYLSFGREAGEWVPNVQGGEENLEAISFLQELNTGIFARYPQTLMVAEEATDWEKVTSPVNEGGLGFNFKWNMGWMNDICRYIDLDPLARQHHHKALTFPLVYAFKENYILPISHDEVVHEKSAFLGKMAGDTFQKLSSSRAFQLYILTHPGKKLTFMGAEIGQWNEWDFHHSMDWHLLEYDDHKRIQHFHQKANALYLNTPALWERDGSWDGFLWLCADDNLGNTIAYARYDEAGNPLVVVCNFSPVHRHGYRLPFPQAGIWEEVLNTDWEEFGGANHRNEGDLHTENVECYGQAQSREINLPPNGVIVFGFSKKNEMKPVELLTAGKSVEKVETTADFSTDESSMWEENQAKQEISDLDEEDVVVKKRTGRKKKVVEAEILEEKAGSELTIGEMLEELPEPEKKKTGSKKKVEEEPVAEVEEEPLPEPKKRGRKKKTETLEDAVVHTSEPPKKRGRKKKEEVEEVLGDPGDMLDELVNPPKKVGRPKKVDPKKIIPLDETSLESLSEPPKQEELAPKSGITETDAKKLETNVIEQPDGQEDVPKRRGRPKKTVDFSKATSKTTVKRGRPKKS